MPFGYGRALTPGTGNPPASAGWVLSLRAPPRNAAPVDSTRKLHNPIILQCACSTRGTLPALALRGPLPPRHPSRLRQLASAGKRRSAPQLGVGEPALGHVARPTSATASFLPRCPAGAGVAGGREGGDPSCAEVACRLCCRRTPRSSPCAICELNRPEHTTGSGPELTGPATPKPAGTLATLPSAYPNSIAANPDPGRRPGACERSRFLP